MKGSGVDLNWVPVLLRSGGASALDGRDGAAQSWQREMERAQIQAWLGHTVLGFPGTQSPMPSLAGTTTQPVGAANTLPVVAMPVQEPLPAPGDCARNANIVPLGDRFPISMRSDPAVASLREVEGEGEGEDGDAVLQHPVLPPCIAGTAAMTETVASASASVQHELAQAADRLRLHEEPLRNSPILRTAQLAAVLQGLGTISATTSISGQAAAIDNACAGFAAVPVTPPARKLEGSAPLHPHPQPPFVGAPSAAIAPPVVAATGGGQNTPGAGLRCSRGDVQVLTPAAAGGGALQVGSSTATRATPRDPIRLHADWSTDGVRLWLGMDASMGAALQSVTTHLQRWLSAQGVRLLSISCNGRLVVAPRETSMAASFEADPTPGEAPSRGNPPSSSLKEFP